MLSDFGIAKSFDMSAEGGSSWKCAKADGGDWFPLLWPLHHNPHVVDGRWGTISFSAPEVSECERYSYGADYYSFAVTLFYSLTGKLPWAVDDTGECREPRLPDLERRKFGRVVLEDVEREFFIEVSDYQGHEASLTLNRSFQAFHPNTFNRWPNVHAIKVHAIWQGL